ncbi:hypothetical protein [Actinomadura sp. DC4]|uniref:type I-G CRISPR-associated protein, Cas3-extension family n=1 Tax=Actinomadura sp. DC4 TaxID=3055069 RepID=UPI0025B14419|nr:hypothetical protein [Actinomadura sp. DC4]MDN3360101.1 hypothetical protein [Actinomadura sp. DC4]
MTFTVELPALDGRDPLGFLATLGLHAVLTVERGAEVRLSFSDTTGCALLYSDLDSTRAIADALAAVVARAGDETAIVGVDDRFPLRKLDPATARATGASESDPMRVPREEYPALVARVAEMGENAVRWLRVLITDLGVDRSGRAALTPYCAPAGKQDCRTFFFKPLQAVRQHPEFLREALEGWRRVDYFTGEYLDHRVIRDAGHHPRGESVTAGVPGATWLATQALPLLRLTGDGTYAAATLWHRYDRRSVMIWPLWTQPLDLDGVQAFLEHPALRPRRDSPLSVPREVLQTLGAFTAVAAERQPLSKSAGALAPLPIVF